ncbi:uncharacterized protein [Pleurodeles waltl]|uniref:uncharacterized protein isoform X1 n=1 Tax=Pleurodeles waltl TaxID=8319 RepID=UPI0037099C38
MSEKIFHQGTMTWETALNLETSIMWQKNVIDGKVSITFSDVAAYFYEEEWKRLEAWQKQLYKNVMKEIHKALFSMGYKIVNSDILLRIKDDEESYFTNGHIPEKKRCLHSTKSSSQEVKPDILFRIKEAHKLYVMDPPNSGERKARKVPIASNPVFNPDMSIWIKQVEEPHFSNHHVVERRTSNAYVINKLYGTSKPEHPVSAPVRRFCIKTEEGSMDSANITQGRRSVSYGPLMTYKETSADLSLCVKQEEQSSPVKIENSQKVELLHDPLAGTMPGTSLSMKLGKEQPPTEDAKNTQILIKTSLAIFKYYLSARHLDLRQVEQYSKNQLNRLLCMFYSGMRKPNGDYYAKKSITSFRYGLQRHFAQLKGFDIIHDPAFRDANTTMAAMFARMKSEGWADVQHKEPLTKEDFKKLYYSCDINTPAGLQHKVFIDVMLHLCSRGREKLREFNKDEFLIAIDAKGHKYVSARKTRFPKNNQGMPVEHDRGPRMYELRGNPKCPVLSFEKYVMKLHPGHTAFWQRPKLAAPSNSSPWYSNTPVGKNTLGNYMKTLSQDYGLSRLYTNHCLRVTCNMVLEDMCMLKSVLQ